MTAVPFYQAVRVNQFTETDQISLKTRDQPEQNEQNILMTSVLVSEIKLVSK